MIKINPEGLGRALVYVIIFWIGYKLCKPKKKKTQDKEICKEELK